MGIRVIFGSEIQKREEALFSGLHLLHILCSYIFKIF